MKRQERTRPSCEGHDIVRYPSESSGVGINNPTQQLLAGWDANEMLEGADGILAAAAASGEDLALISDIVTNSYWSVA